MTTSLATEHLTTIVDIRNWLQSQDALPLEQFAIDWIEKYVDRAEEILDSPIIETDDDTFRGAIHYETQTVLEVLRPDVLCYRLFRELESLTRSNRYEQ